MLIYNRLQRWLRRLRPFSHLIFILIINSVLNRILYSYFFLCVELKNYRNGCNQAVNKLKFNYLQFDEVVTELVTVVTKSHNYIQINKLRVVTKNEQLVYLLLSNLILKKQLLESEKNIKLSLHKTQYHF